MQEDLSGKVALVTGGGSGIGLASARSLSEAGATVVLAGRTESKLRDAAAGLPGPTHVVVQDISASDAGDKLVAAAIGAAGSLDIVLANAGLYLPGDIWDSAPDDIDRLISTNVSGLIQTVRAAVIALRAAGTGDIVVTSSVSGYQAIHWEPVYSASKHAVQAFVHGVRRQLQGSGVRIGSVAPGVVLNDLWQVTSEEEIAAKVASGDGVRSEDVADAVLFMLTRPRHVQIRDLVILPVNQPI
ncbi:SDR family NAD(P)-dependent oxidoreductase [Nakamurella sp. YIM 132087]|uniref:SDR family NAD(P)-dependent oxidoreductase n=1 Tax=Nakamurella alba TaxID=2665158 RepID=A0A7K1FH32_9ACTN|nr:SDR family oxidoreductase [Nakamurella alba]MTD13408.1 SDR family NAD(P)-dependent oxidoreductase [Nakamurella alba]